MEPTAEQVEAGHAFYTRRALALYNLAILGYFSRVAWKCPAPRIVEHYDAHVSPNHLDVGVGTGYFLDHCRFPTPPRLALMDLNPNCLEVAAPRVARYAPEVYCANVLEPIELDVPKFDSVGLNYLLHCLPGSIRVKAVVFEYLRALANPGAVIFGATLLGGGVPEIGWRERSWTATTQTGSSRMPAMISKVSDGCCLNTCPDPRSRSSAASRFSRVASERSAWGSAQLRSKGAITS